VDYRYPTCRDPRFHASSHLTLPLEQEAVCSNGGEACVFSGPVSAWELGAILRAERHGGRRRRYAAKLVGALRNGLAAHRQLVKTLGLTRRSERGGAFLMPDQALQRTGPA
jgi:hypothetical protein